MVKYIAKRLGLSVLIIPIVEIVKLIQRAAAKSKE